GRGVADRRIIIAGPLHIGDRGIVVGRKAELVVKGGGHCCVSCVSTGRPSRGLCLRLMILGSFLNSGYCIRPAQDRAAWIVYWSAIRAAPAPWANPPPSSRSGRYRRGSRPAA